MSAETNAYQLLVTDEKDLAGLPEGAVEAAHALAKANEKKAGFLPWISRAIFLLSLMPTIGNFAKKLPSPQAAKLFRITSTTTWTMSLKL
jgi:hypothetical protein